MLSVDGDKTFLAGSDQVLSPICGPCSDDGDVRDASFYCEVCNEKLCKDCRDEHNKFKATKKHRIVSVSECSEECKETFTITCSCDKKRVVELYCENHGEVICPSCETIKHRNCNTSPLQDHVNKDTQNKISVAIEKSKTLENKIEQCKRNREIDCNTLEKQKSACREEIKEFRREICRAAEKMEENMLKNLDDKTSQHRLPIEKHISTLTAALEALQLDKDILEDAKKSGKETLMFAADIKTSKSLREYEDLIRDLTRTIRQPRLVVERNRSAVDILNDLESQCKIISNDIEVRNVILDMEVQSSTEVNIELQDDSELPDITGCCFLTNGDVLLCDYNNKKVKLLDGNWILKKSLTFHCGPCDIAVFNEQESVVTIPNAKKLQFVHMLPDMKLGGEITLGATCYGIDVFKDEIYTAVKTEIWKLDKAGNILSRINLPEVFTYPDYIRLSKSGSFLRVYLTEWSYSKLLCLSIDGTVAFQYEDNDLKELGGIYVDSGGNCFVCGKNSNNFVVITADGKKHKTLLTDKEITDPRSIAFRPEDGTLVVGCSFDLTLFVFKLAN